MSGDCRNLAGQVRDVVLLCAVRELWSIHSVDSRRGALMHWAGPECLDSKHWSCRANDISRIQFDAFGVPAHD